MQISKIFTSKAFIITTWVLALLIILFITFSAGVRLGISKATHNFERRGMAPRIMPHGTGTPSAFMERGEFGETKGAAGPIVSINESEIVVKDKNDENRVITIDGNTKIKKAGSTIEVKDLTVGDFIIVFGDSESGEKITPKLIRVLPNIEDLKPII